MDTVITLYNSDTVLSENHPTLSATVITTLLLDRCGWYDDGDNNNNN